MEIYFEMTVRLRKFITTESQKIISILIQIDSTGFNNQTYTYLCSNNLRVYNTVLLMNEISESKLMSHCRVK